VRIFAFPLHAHRAITCSAGRPKPAPIPRQLVLLRDEDVAALRTRDDSIGRREADRPPHGHVIDLTCW